MKTWIKYDKRFQKACGIVMLVTGSLLLLGTLMLVDFGDSKDVSNWMILIMLAAYGSVPLFPLTTILFLDATVYLRRLEKNHFSIPEKKEEYGNDLSRLPRTEAVENLYAKDSLIAMALALALYLIFALCDILYLVKWLGYGESDATVMFVILMVLHLYFPIRAFLFYRQKDTEKYVDEVDVRNGRRARTSLMGAVGVLVFVSCIATFSVIEAHSMTKYIYKSRYGRYEKTLDDFLKKATMTVRSDSLHNGMWDVQITNTEDGSNRSPQISFEPVEGADHYVIYMVDESANNWVHWLALDVRETELEFGANQGKYGNDEGFQYVGPYPPKGSGEHVYTVYVYALKAEPDGNLTLEFDETFLGGDLLYYDHLNISEKGNPEHYGNVLAYGYLSGNYGR